MAIAMNDALRKLKEIIGDFYITGSFSLKEYGRITRNIGDLDIVVNNRKAFKTLEKHFSLKYFFNYIPFTDEEMKANEAAFLKETKGKSRGGMFDSMKMRTLDRVLSTHRREANQAQFHMSQMKIDVFYMDGEPEHKLITDSYGEYYKVAHPKYSIQAKRDIVKNLKEQSKSIPLNQTQLDTLAKHSKDLAELGEL